MLNARARCKEYGAQVGRWLSLSLGAAAAIGLALWLVGPQISPLVLASLGGSTVFLFGLTSAPAAQPRALIGGHLGSAVIGIVCYQLFGESTGTAVMAVVLALVFMLQMKMVHPPAGANPLIMVYGHADFWTLLHPVGLGVLALALVVIVWSRLDRWSPNYPVNCWALSPPPLTEQFPGEKK